MGSKSNGVTSLKNLENYFSKNRSISRNQAAISSWKIKLQHRFGKAGISIGKIVCADENRENRNAIQEMGSPLIIRQYSPLLRIIAFVGRVILWNTSIQDMNKKGLFPETILCPEVVLF